MECRLCAEKTNQIQDLFAWNFSTGLLIVSFIKDTCDIQIKQDDGLGSNICSKCIRLTMVSYRHRSKVIETNRKLLEREKSADCSTTKSNEGVQNKIEYDPKEINEDTNIKPAIRNSDEKLPKEKDENIAELKEKEQLATKRQMKDKDVVVVPNKLKKKYERVSHSKETAHDQTIETHKCLICNRCFASKTFLVLHVAAKHDSQNNKTSTNKASSKEVDRKKNERNNNNSKTDPTNYTKRGDNTENFSGKDANAPKEETAFSKITELKETVKTSNNNCVLKVTESNKLRKISSARISPSNYSWKTASDLKKTVLDLSKKKYVCQTCNISFISDLELRTHCKMDHNICKYCKIKFSLPAELEQHSVVCLAFFSKRLRLPVSSDEGQPSTDDNIMVIGNSSSKTKVDPRGSQKKKYLQKPSIKISKNNPNRKGIENAENCAPIDVCKYCNIKFKVPAELKQHLRVCLPLFYKRLEIGSNQNVTKPNIQTLSDGNNESDHSLQQETCTPKMKDSTDIRDKGYKELPSTDDDTTNSPDKTTINTKQFEKNESLQNRSIKIEDADSYVPIEMTTEKEDTIYHIPENINFMYRYPANTPFMLSGLIPPNIPLHNNRSYFSPLPLEAYQGRQMWNHQSSTSNNFVGPPPHFKP